MKKKLLIGIIFIVLFITLTVLLLFVDRKAIGPNESVVGFALINQWFHNLTGVNWNLYTITDFGGIPPIAMGMFLGVIGLIQWIKRKNILKVDIELIILGIFYILVFLIFVAFQFLDINRRPVLVDGVLEVSYPSSTTFLSITFLLSIVIPIKKYINNEKTRKLLILLANIYMIFLIVVRILSGVHWFTDVLGSILIGLGLVYIYEYFIDLFREIQSKKIKD